MRHKNRQPGTFKMQVERKLRLNPPVVDVAEHAAQGFELLEFFNQFEGAEIAGMPYFVAVGEMVKNLFVQVRMRIGKQTDFHFKGELVRGEQKETVVSGILRAKESGARYFGDGQFLTKTWAASWSSWRFLPSGRSQNFSIESS